MFPEERLCRKMIWTVFLLALTHLAEKRGCLYGWSSANTPVWVKPRQWPPSRRSRLFRDSNYGGQFAVAQKRTVTTPFLSMVLFKLCT